MILNPMWPQVNGISRDASHDRSLLIALSRRPTDDEMRELHDALRTPTADGPWHEAVAYACESMGIECSHSPRRALADLIGAVVRDAYFAKPDQKRELGDFNREITQLLSQKIEPMLEKLINAAVRDLARDVAKEALRETLEEMKGKEKPKSFKNSCTCGGYAWSMNGRDPKQPHMSWCPQAAEYAEYVAKYGIPGADV